MYIVLTTEMTRVNRKKRASQNAFSGVATEPESWRFRGADLVWLDAAMDNAYRAHVILGVRDDSCSYHHIAHARNPGGQLRHLFAWSKVNQTRVYLFASQLCFSQTLYLFWSAQDYYTMDYSGI